MCLRFLSHLFEDFYRLKSFDLRQVLTELRCIPLDNVTFFSNVKISASVKRTPVFQSIHVSHCMRSLLEWQFCGGNGMDKKAKAWDNFICNNAKHAKAAATVGKTYKTSIEMSLNMLTCKAGQSPTKAIINFIKRSRKQPCFTLYTVKIIARHV